MPLYTLREIPKKLHRRWKLMSSIHQVSMRDIALKALETYIDMLEKSVNVNMEKLKDARREFTGKSDDDED